MGLIGDAFSSIDISSDVKENDEEMMYSMERLLSIINMFVDDYRDIILEIYVSPMNMLQRRLSDIKHLSIYVIHIGYVDEERLKTMREDLDAYVNGEFDDIKGGVSVELNIHYKPDIPMLCVYSMFEGDKEGIVNALTTDELYVMKALAQEHDCTFSLPYNYAFLSCKSFFTHCGSTENMIPLRNTITKEYGSSMKEFDADVKYKMGDVVYVPMISKSAFKYDIPYVYLTADDFVIQNSN